MSALAPAAAERAASQSQFQFTAAVLGTLPGGFASAATALNDSGQVVGYDWTGLAYHSFIWQNGVMTGLGTPGTQAFAINVSGQVVGGSSGRAFIWQNGVMTDLGTPGGFSVAYGINDSGQVVGTFFPPGFTSVQGNGHAFLWHNGVTIDLGTLGGLESRAMAINASGQVVGEAMTASGDVHAFLWQDGVMTDLGTLGGRWSTAWDINDLGQVAGVSDTATGSCALPDGTLQTDYHAVLWEGGVIRDLQPTGCRPAIAYAINNSSHVVGEIDSCNLDGLGGHCGPASAFLYSNGVMHDLNDLVPGIGLWIATGINDLGQIVANGNEGAYRLDPGPLCSLPDPFVSLGGGTCWNGGWLPPGMLPPTSAPPPPSPPASPPAGSGSCATPDPFVSLGGGTCDNGGWLPPGMSPPSSPSPPTAPPAPSPPPPPYAPGSCTTPDPFASLGGGTCFNGGWLPPGMTPPTTPPPTTTPSGGCSTPDPFVGLPGLIGMCVNGGWIPIVRSQVS